MIDRDAFLATASETSIVYISNCDLSLLDFAWLDGFNKLTSLSFYESSNLHQASWTSLPILNRLSKLSINFCKGLNERFDPPVITSLREIQLEGNGLLDQPMGRLLNWVLISSAESLTKLQMSMNLLTRVPTQIASFKNLNYLDIHGQENGTGMLVTKGSLSFQSPVKYIYAAVNGISTIEPGAFEGNF